MGKKFLIYLKGDTEEEFELEESKSQLVSRLLKEHYAEGEEALKAKLEELEDEKAKVVKKLKNKAQEAAKEARKAKERGAQQKSERDSAFERTQRKMERDRKIEEGKC